MLTHFKLAVTSVAVISASLMITGCNTQPNHPNQLSAFDGASYDSLTLAHGALTSLSGQISATYPQYASAFNQAAATYLVAFEAYSVYRSAPNTQAQVDVDISNLTASIVALENAFESDLHVPAATVQKIRSRASDIRAAATPDTSAIDILTELEVAAEIAEAVPAAEPYAKLAAVVIAATESAVAAEQSAAGQPIDLSTIQPVNPIQ